MANMVKPTNFAFIRPEWCLVFRGHSLCNVPGKPSAGDSPFALALPDFE